MSQLLNVHERLNTIDWNSLFEYSEDSPTFLKWKNEYRIGNKGTLTKRKSLTVGGINSEGYLVVTIDKKPYSIPKIIWVMKFGSIPKNFSVYFKDGNNKNASVSNLEIKELAFKPKEKYDNSIRQFLAYDESSPSFLRWIDKSSKSSNINIGDVAGSLDESDGYWKLHGLGNNYKVHRLVWFLHYGNIPKGYHVDHIDRDRQNNNILNLRVVPPSINGKNRSKNKNNTTGVNGITYGEFVNERGTLIRRFVVTILCDGKKHQRSFSLEKYGDSIAWELALKAKDEIVNELKRCGAGFTEDHGT